MKHVLQRFDSIIAKMHRVNAQIAEGNTENTGFGPRFIKLMHQSGRRIESIGIYDYHTKKYVLFDMVNMVGSKNLPKELKQMDSMLNVNG